MSVIDGLRDIINIVRDVLGLPKICDVAQQLHGDSKEESDAELAVKRQ